MFDSEFFLFFFRYCYRNKRGMYLALGKPVMVDIL